MALTEDMILTRSKLMLASGEEIGEVFGEQPKSSERVKLVMEADKLFLAKMAGEVVGTALLASQLSLGGKEASSLTTENVDDKTAALSVGSVKVRTDFKISGQIDSKSEI